MLMLHVIRWLYGGHIFERLIKVPSTLKGNREVAMHSQLHTIDTVETEQNQSTRKKPLNLKRNPTHP